MAGQFAHGLKVRLGLGSVRLAWVRFRNKKPWVNCPWANSPVTLESISEYLGMVPEVGLRLPGVGLHFNMHYMSTRMLIFG